MSEPTHETAEPQDAPVEHTHTHTHQTEDTEVPQETDNTEREIDPAQDISQDPNVDYSKPVEDTL